MLLSAVSVLVVAQSSSEIPEGLMNNIVLSFNFTYFLTVALLSNADHGLLISKISRSHNDAA